MKQIHLTSTIIYKLGNLGEEIPMHLWEDLNSALRIAGYDESRSVQAAVRNLYRLHQL